MATVPSALSFPGSQLCFSLGADLIFSCDRLPPCSWVGGGHRQLYGDLSLRAVPSGCGCRGPQGGPLPGLPQELCRKGVGGWCD